MSRPSINFFAQSFIPSVSFPFGLLQKDIRLLWAVNCGSLSNIDIIPIYRPDVLEEQLNQNLSLSLNKQVQFIDPNILVLPVICQWYLKDFAEMKSGDFLIISSLFIYLFI